MKELIEIQQELKAPKNQYNSFGKYNYRNCEDILEAVKPLLAKSGLCMTIQDDLVNIGERYYVKATVTVSKDKESISVSAFARESEDRKGMDDSQVTGATSSYARKYALNGMFLIDDTKDADTTDNRKTSEKKAEESKPIITQLQKLKAELNKRGAKNASEALTLLNKLTGNVYSSIDLDEQSAQEALASIYQSKIQ